MVVGGLCVYAQMQRCDIAMDDGRVMEKRQQTTRRRLEQACYGGLEAAVERAGGELTGLAMRTNDGSVLLTLKARFPAGHVVGFVGSDSIAGCLLKAVVDAKRDAVRWKPDQYKQRST